MSEEAVGSWYRGCRSATFSAIWMITYGVLAALMSRAFIFFLLCCLQFILQKNTRWKSSFPLSYTSAAQTLISVSRVNPHHPLNGTKTIMRIKLQRRDKAVHLPCMAGSCLSNYSATQTQTEQKKAISAWTCFSHPGQMRLESFAFEFLKNSCRPSVIWWTKGCSSIVNRGGCDYSRVFLSGC